MGVGQIALELVLLLLLAATLFHAVRLERALGMLKRDRAVLEALVTGFNESTRQADAGVQRLRQATEGAGRQMARQLEQAQRLRDDLSFLTDRGERLAERLETCVRAARMASDGAALAGAAAAGLPAGAPGGIPAGIQAGIPGGMQAGMALTAAAQGAGLAAPLPGARLAPASLPAAAAQAAPVPAQAGPVAGASRPPPGEDPATRLRSAAERDLLRALRAAR